MEPFYQPNSLILGMKTKMASVGLSCFTHRFSVVLTIFVMDKGQAYGNRTSSKSVTTLHLAL